MPLTCNCCRLWLSLNSRSLMSEPVSFSSPSLIVKSCIKNTSYSKTCLKRLLKRRLKIGFQDRLAIIAGQKYCRMLQGEHSAILLTCIKWLSVFKTFVLSFLSGRLRQVLQYFKYGIDLYIKTNRGTCSNKTHNILLRLCKLNVFSKFSGISFLIWT